MALTLNRAKMTTTTTGTGTVTLGEAVSPYQSFSSANAQNGGVYSYLIEDVNGAWELGLGTYTSSGTTFSRTLDQSSTGSLLNLSGVATIALVSRASDGPQLISQVSPTGTGTVTFSVIPTTFKDLQVVVRGNGTAASTSAEIIVRYNNDSGANYNWQESDTTNTTTTTFTSFATTEWRPGFVTGATSPANSPGATDVRIFDYNGTTFYKEAQGRSTLWFDTTSIFQRIAHAVWKNTAAITRVDVILASGNFVAGSNVSLYGLP